MKIKQNIHKHIIDKKFHRNIVTLSKISESRNTNFENVRKKMVDYANKRFAYNYRRKTIKILTNKYSCKAIKNTAEERPS